MTNPIDDELTLEEQAQEFMEYARLIPEADLEAMLRAMKYIAANPGHEYVTEAKLAKFVEQLKNRH